MAAARSRSAHSAIAFLTIRALLVAFAGFLAVGSPSAHAEPIDADQFLADFRRAIRSLIATYTNVKIEGSFESVTTEPPNTHTPERKNPKGPPLPAREARRVATFSYVFTDGFERLTSEPGGEIGRSTFIQSSNQRFGLTQATPGGPYSLRHLSGGGENIKALARVRDVVRDAAFRPYGAARFPDHVDSPRFKVESAVRARKGGRSWSRVRLPTRSRISIDLMYEDGSSWMNHRGWFFEITRSI